MAWSSKAVVLFVVVSLVTIPVQSQRSRSNRNSSSSLSSGAIGAIVTLSVVICGCCLGVCCVCWVYHSDKNQGQHRGAPPRAFVSNNNARYPRATTQQTPTVVYNTGYSQTPIYYHGNAGTASNGQGQQFSQPVYYATVNHQASPSGDSEQQDTRQEATQVNLYQATLLAEPPTYEEAANLRAPSSTQQTVEPDTLPPPSYRSSTQILNEN